LLSDAVEMEAEKFTISPGAPILIAVPLPGPGSASKKYSADVMLCDRAEIMKRIIIQKSRSLFIPISFNGEKWYLRH